MHQINASNQAASRSELWPKENNFHDSGTEEDEVSMVNSSDSVSNIDHDDSVSHSDKSSNNMSRTEYFTEDNLSDSPHSQPNNDHHHHHSSSPSWPTVNLLSEKADHPPHPHDKLNYPIINSSPETLAPQSLNSPSTPNSTDHFKEELDSSPKESRLHKNSGTPRRTRKSSGRNGPITLKIRKVTKYRRKADGLDESYDFYQVLGGPKANQGKTNANGSSKPIVKENSASKTDRKRKVLDSQVSNNDQGSGRLKPYTLSALSSTVQSCADLEIRDLPKDILLRIFRTIVINDESKALSNLLSLSQVAEEWRQVILSSESLWKTIDFSGLKPTSTAELLEFCKLGVLDHATHLNLSGWSDAITASVFPQILKRCGQNLKNISLRECYNTNGQTISLLEEHCPHLEELDLSRVSDTYAQSPNKKAKNGPSPTLLFPNRFQQFLTKNGSRLKGLTLSENKIFKINVVVDAIVEHCNNLQSLDLSNIISHSSFTLSLETLQESCPKLKVLRLGNIHIKPPKGLCTGFPLLEELSIPCNNSDTGHLENVISSFTHSAENLKLLDIRGSSKVTSSCLIKIPAWNLQHLAIDNCLAIFANGLDMVVSKWKHSLIELDVSQNNYQEGISAALEQISAEKNSPLESITLRGSSVSFESVSKLVMNCSNLKMIDLQSCRALPRGTKRVFRDQEIQEFRDEISKGSYL